MQKDRAIDCAAEGREAADGDADQKAERQKHAEHTRCDVADRERRQGARDSDQHCTDAENHRLVDHDIDAQSLCSGRMIADRKDRATDPAMQQIGRQDERDRQYEQRQQIQPLVETQEQPERNLGYVDAHALSTPGPVLYAFVLCDAGQHGADGKGRHREMHGLHAQHGQAEQKSDHQTDRPRDRHRGPVRHVEMNDENHGRVGAHGIESAMPEGDLAVIADQDVHPEQRDGVDQDVGEFEELEIRGIQRNQRGGAQHGAQACRFPESNGTRVLRHGVAMPREECISRKGKPICRRTWAFFSP